MPTVTAIALETLLEPGSSSSGSQHNRGGHGIGNPPPSRPHSLKEDHSRLRGARGGSSAASSSLKEHHRHQPGVRREQQPIFLSRRPRDESEVSVAADRNDDPAQAAGSRAKSTANGYYISPKLYATPEPTLIVPTGGISSSSLTSVSSPSPYVVNHKRRDLPRPPPPLPSTSNDKGGAFPPIHLEGSDSATKAPNSTMEVTVRELTNGTHGGRSDEQEDEEGLRKVEDENNSSDLRSHSGGLSEKECPDASIDDDMDDNFFDPRELMSTVSSSDTEDGGSVLRSGSGRCHTPLASLSEFYDANEDFFSDGSVSRASPSFRASIEADLRSIRLDLFEEMDRRKKAEDALEHLQNILQRMAEQLSPVSAVTFSLSRPGGKDPLWDASSAAQFCQEVIVTRMVSEALERGLAGAEAEAAAEAVIEVKNHEIARLRDRLQYYEAVNQEMSQRNQEAIELARRQRQRRKVRRRWVVGCVGLSIAVGASLMAFSYLGGAHGGRHEPAPVAAAELPAEARSA
ncbi:unnamed protein product [Spirodela intermedia]|uniref:Uncharacterized protein n=1 Tax=Spirodela intermedia TaxID=51605 RepID=A0A7I8L911_SPIIN|nr:unnamed protein product [Spirodela intermedia]